MQGLSTLAPIPLQMAGRGGTMSRRTANKKLTKLYWPSRKRSPRRIIVLWQPKNGGIRQKKFFRRFAPDRCPPPTFKLVPALLGSAIRYAMRKWRIDVVLFVFSVVPV